MRRGSKMGKRSYNKRGVLCNLPDEILIHILCLLPLRDAVATGLLSKRWQHLWTMIPHLRINETQFNNNRNQFMKFMEGALVHRDHWLSSLVSFSLSCRVLRDSARINSWITAALCCNVEELRLVLDTVLDQTYILPSFLFMCTNLKRLHLEMGQTLVIPTTVTTCFPSLKKLSMRGVRFADDESAQKLLSCPLLEELIIEWCDWVNTKAVTVYAPNLENLIFYDLVRSIGHEHVEVDQERKVWIVGAAKLKNFWHFGEFTNELCIFGTSSEQLQNAEIWMVPQAQELVLDVDAIKRGYKLLTSFAFVRNLTLSEDLLEALEANHELLETIPVFNYMRELTLTGRIRINMAVLLKIFERSPYLENVVFHRAVCDDYRLIKVEPLPSCFERNVKKMTILNLYNRSEDYNGVSILLRNAGAALDKMIIHYLDHNTGTRNEVQAHLDQLGQYIGQPHYSKLLLV